MRSKQDWTSTGTAANFHSIQKRFYNDNYSEQQKGHPSLN